MARVKKTKAEKKKIFTQQNMIRIVCLILVGVTLLGFIPVVLLT